MITDYTGKKVQIVSFDKLDKQTKIELVHMMNNDGTDHPSYWRPEILISIEVDKEWI